MATTTDRVGEFLDGVSRNRRVLLSPEGVPLDIRIAGHGERLTAFAIDMAILLAGIVLLYIVAALLFVSSGSASVVMTLVLFIAFLVRNCYFAHFELAWQGRTPGKRACGLRVINRAGGELTPGAVIARNLTREVEFFLPLTLLFSLDAEGGFWQQLTLLVWVLLVASLPLWNRDHLRAGDVIGGTQVIAMPKRVLLKDLTVAAPGAMSEGFSFTHGQLSVYGAFELQVLEELLRRPRSAETDKLLDEVCAKIRRKIGWEGDVPQRDVRRFLTEFYSAERGELERGKLFGRLREDKTGSVQ